MTNEPKQTKSPVHAPNIFPDYDLVLMGFESKLTEEDDLAYYEWNLQLYPELCVQVTISYIGPPGKKTYRESSYVELGGPGIDSARNWIRLPDIDSIEKLRNLVYALNPNKNGTTEKERH